MSCSVEIVRDASKVTLQISMTTQLRAPFIEDVLKMDVIDASTVL